jgi:UDP-N-acetylglucosamine:LPS N-acetylglucosamine transferase
VLFRAAISQGRPTLLHEQNAVLGRTNRWLAPYVDAIASAFPQLSRVPEKSRTKVRLIGNPVRAAIAQAAHRPYAAPGPTDPVHLLVTGGSQGSRILSETVPVALATLPESLQDRLRVVQQSRAESLETAHQTYLDAAIAAEVAPFFKDMAERLSQAHLLIGRAGASTCTELATMALPSLLIPLKIAMDDHQTANAQSLVRAGGAEMLSEDDVTVDRLAEVLAALVTDPDRLRAMSAGARSAALPEATQKLADLVETVAVR